MTNKYHNRLGYDLSAGDVVILTDHFDVQGQEWNAGEQLTVVIIHSDWGHLWGVETVDGLKALSGYYLGYGEAMLIEYVRPLREDEEREPTMIDAEMVRDLLRTTLGVADVTPTALPSADKGGMTWQDYENAMAFSVETVEELMTVVNQPKHLPKTTDFFSRLVAEQQANNLFNSRGIMFESGEKARLVRDVDSVGLWAGWICTIRHIEGEWIAEFNNGDVYLKEAPEVLELL